MDAPSFLCAAAVAASMAVSLGAADALPIRKRHCSRVVYPQNELPPPRQPCFSLDDCDRKAFDELGTRGRMGLGADPAHPEGPGNFSD